MLSILSYQTQITILSPRGKYQLTPLRYVNNSIKGLIDGFNSKSFIIYEYITYILNIIIMIASALVVSIMN